MSNECRYAVSETLRNGISVTIRAVRPSDRERLIAAFHKLEPESIYTRFFAYKDELSEADLKRATEIDFERRVVLLVTIANGAEETVIGAGSYTACTRSPTVCSAEVGFIVEEDYHGLGIAGRILHHLAVIARERGIGQFEAEVLPENRAMVSVFARSGFPMTEKRVDGTIRVTMKLPDAIPAD
ncbi:MAG TPA: GNAT family N-acetyltransferase [Burkholderiales bacterium]|nr:GNAT family N-acetyltransferase [Burkholderiales bacterium]